MFEFNFNLNQKLVSFLILLTNKKLRRYFWSSK